MSGSPQISVIIPCYNLGRYLDEAVDSVFDQTFDDWEILIVDDGSTDPETVRVFENYRREKTRVFRTPNRGVSHARNFAVGEARGSYLCFLDADDKLAPTCLEKTWRHLEANPSLAFASFGVRFFGDQEGEWLRPSCDLLSLLGECTVSTAALLRREAFTAVGGFNPKMHLGHEDWDLWLTLVERGFRGEILPEFLFWYRRRPSSRSTTADSGSVYLSLYRTLLEKHAYSYRKLLFEALWVKERELLGRIAENARDLEELDHRVRPRAECARVELEQLRSELMESAAHLLPPSPLSTNQDSSAELATLRSDLARAHQELVDLRSSQSWKWTRPLRQAQDWLMRVGGRR